MTPEWQVSIAIKTPPHIEIERPTLNRKLPNLGPWNFIFNEFEIEYTINGYHVFFLPTFPYFDNESVFQRTVYLVKETNDESAWPPVTFLDVEPGIGLHYLNSIGQYLKSHTSSFDINQPWIILAFNISGHNHYLITKGILSPQTIKDELGRTKLAQSVPVLHAQLLISSDPNFIKRLPTLKLGSLTPDNEIYPALSQKLIKEMGFEPHQITPELITQCLTLMRKDEPAVARWEQIINPKQISATFNQITECTWFDDNYGLGLRIRLPYSLLDGLCQNGETIWSILRAIEEKLACSGLFSLDQSNDFLLPSYNFTVTFREEESGMTIDFCPHDSIRAGPMEQMGIFVCRPNRNNT